MRALRMWKIGISEDKETISHHHPLPYTLGTPSMAPVSLHRPPPPVAAQGKWEWGGLTDLDREAWRQAEGNEIPELGKKCIADGHEVNDGGHLLTQGQGMLLTQPQLGLEPAPRSQGVRDIVEAMASQHIMEALPSQPCPPPPALPSPASPAPAEGLTSVSWWSVPWDGPCHGCQAQSWG